jgi:hypothetical protein
VPVTIVQATLRRSDWVMSTCSAGYFLAVPAHLFGMASTSAVGTPIGPGADAVVGVCHGLQIVQVPPSAESVAPQVVQFKMDPP